MEIWKEVIRPDTYTYSGKNGEPLVLQITPEMVRHLHKQGRAMLSAGLSIPIPVEHPAEGEKRGQPLTPAEVAAETLRNNAGWVKGYRMVKDVLWGLHDIKDKDIEKKIDDGTCCWTSPKIEGKFTDGDGKTWNGVVTHHALTLRPRVVRQKPFELPAAAAMSLNAATPTPLKETLATGTYTVSKARLLSKTESGWNLKFPALFALETDMDEDEKPKETEEEAAETVADEVPAEVVEEEVVDPAIGDEANADELLCHLLDLKGIPVDMGAMTSGNFKKMLGLALIASLKADKATTEADALQNELGTDDDMVGDPPLNQEQQPMYMSLQTVDKTKDPLAKAMVKKAFADAETARKKKVANLVRRMPSAQAEIEKIVGSCALSLNTATGEVEDPAGPMLAVFDKHLASIQLSRQITGQPGAMEQEHPQDEGQFSQKRADEIANETLARLPANQKLPVLAK